MFLIHDNISIDITSVTSLIITANEDKFEVIIPVIGGEFRFGEVSDYETAEAFRNAIHEVIQIYDHANGVEGVFPGEPPALPQAYELIVEEGHIKCVPIESLATHFDDESFSVPIQSARLQRL